jgi:chitodextrinase
MWDWYRRQWWQTAVSGFVDTEAPTVPGNLAASSITATGLTLTWDASTDNVGVTEYEVQQRTSAGPGAWGTIGTPPTTFFNVTGLTAGTSYDFRVRAVDAAGNTSTWSPDDDGLSVQTVLVFTDPTFNGTVLTIIDDGSGGKYVGGTFTSVTCNVAATTYTTGYERLVHLLPNGQVDAAWSCPANNTVWALQLDVTNDRLYVGGEFASTAGIGGANRNRLARVTASTGVVDTGWTCNVATFGSIVYALALDVTNDRLFVGGSVFTSIGGASKTRLACVTASTGSVVSGWTCNLNTTTSSVVRTLQLDVTNDRLYVGGDFLAIGGQSRGSLARVVASTGVVSSWTCNTNVVYSLQLDVTNDRLYVGGIFTSIGGQSRNRLARVVASTGVVTSGWTCNVTTEGSAVVVLALDVTNDRLFVGGSVFTSIGGQRKTRLACVTASTGSVISGWTCEATNTLWALQINTTNDWLHVGGSFTVTDPASFAGLTRAGLGTTVASTGGEGPSVPQDLVYSPTLTSVVLSWTASTDNVGVVEYEVQQRLASGVNADFVTVQTVAHPTVTTAITGLTVNTQYRFRVRAQDGSGNTSAYGPEVGQAGLAGGVPSFIDPFFGTSGSQVTRIIDDGSGGKYVGGFFTSVTCKVTGVTYTTGYERLVHLLPNGQVDAAWSCPATGSVLTLQLDVTNDRLYVGGGFNGTASIGGANRDRLARVTASTGVVDSGWTCNATSFVNVLQLDLANDRLFVGGSFNGAASIGGANRDRLALVTASTGVVDSGWTCNIPNSYTRAVAAFALDTANDRLYVGGDFNGTASIGGQTRNRLARVTASTGVVDTGWTCNATDTVRTLQLDVTNDRLYVGGAFDGTASIGGANREHLARVTASTGVVDSGWTCNTNGEVRAFALDLANDHLFTCGSFGTIGGASRAGLARVVASTGLVDANWVCGANDFPDTLQIDTTRDRLFVGGQLTLVGGRTRLNFGSAVASTGVTL